MRSGKLPVASVSERAGGSGRAPKEGARGGDGRLRAVAGGIWDGGLGGLQFERGDLDGLHYERRDVDGRWLEQISRGRGMVRASRAKRVVLLLIFNVQVSLMLLSQSYTYYCRILAQYP